MEASDRVRGLPAGSAAPDPPSGAWPPGWHVHHVAETGSTNADLIAATEAAHRTVLSTGHQTAGRGRLDRRWDAPPGSNLLVSFLFRDRVPADPGDLTRRVGLAAIDASKVTAGVDAVLKWPNDVLVGDRKLGGILAQRVGDGSVVVGLGLNVGWAPDGAARLGGVTTPAEVLRAILRSLDAQPADIAPSYRRSLDTLGRRVRIELPGGEITGRAIDVEADGRLVVLDDCAVTHRVTVGDVVHVRPE